MTRSEAVARGVVQGLRQRLLPPNGAEFELHYFDGDEELKSSEILNRPHTSVSAVSEGLKVTVIGDRTKVIQRRQIKPAYREGIYRTMLVVEIDDVFIHIIGDHIIVAREKLNVGQITPGLASES